MTVSITIHTHFVTTCIFSGWYGGPATPGAKAEAWRLLIHADASLSLSGPATRTAPASWAPASAVRSASASAAAGSSSPLVGPGSRVTRYDQDIIDIDGIWHIDMVIHHIAIVILDIDMVMLDIDMGYGLMIWEMTVSIWSSWISIRDILSLCPAERAHDSPITGTWLPYIEHLNAIWWTTDPL